MYDALYCATPDLLYVETVTGYISFFVLETVTESIKDPRIVCVCLPRNRLSSWLCVYVDKTN